MSLNKPTHVIGFALCLGVVVYPVNALWGAFFIVALPMDPDAIVEADERDVGEDQHGRPSTVWEPTKFKNTLEDLKYSHNVGMRERNRKWMYAVFAVAGLIGFFVFHVIPSRRGTLEQQYAPGSVGLVGAFLGFLAALIVPMLLSAALPAPVKWFPKVITEVAEIRQKEALKRLEAVASEIDASRAKGP